MFVTVWQKNAPRKYKVFEVGTFEEVRPIAEAHEDQDISITESQVTGAAVPAWYVFAGDLAEIRRNRSR